MQVSLELISMNLSWVHCQAGKSLVMDLLASSSPTDTEQSNHIHLQGPALATERRQTC